MIENAITYEQPLNELIRVCLRIEQLLAAIDHQFNDPSIQGSRNVIASIINLLQLLDRPDLKAKLAKELSHQINILTRLQKTPAVDQQKLSALLQQLEELARTFIDSSKKIAQDIREVELLNNLRLHLASPGGGCSFDIPMYHYWLSRPYHERRTTIQNWLAEFNNIRAAVTLVLQLVRESAKFQAKEAELGFYQELLDPQINLRLIRVCIARDLQAYPEISIGRHFLSVRYFVPTLEQRPTQYNHNLPFWIAHCSA